jgi:hypothetical protein
VSGPCSRIAAKATIISLSATSFVDRSAHQTRCIWCEQQCPDPHLPANSTARWRSSTRSSKTSWNSATHCRGAWPHTQRAQCRDALRLLGFGEHAYRLLLDASMWIVAGPINRERQKIRPVLQRSELARVTDKRMQGGQILAQDHRLVRARPTQLGTAIVTRDGKRSAPGGHNGRLAYPSKGLIGDTDGPFGRLKRRSLLAARPASWSIR